MVLWKLAPIFALFALPVPHDGAEVTMDDAARLAVQHSPRIKAAFEASKGAFIEAERKRPVARPDVTAQAIGTVQGPRVTFPRPGGGDATVLPEEVARVELTVEQVLLRLGAGDANLLYKSQRSAAELDFQIEVGAQVHEVQKAYVQLVGAKKMVGVVTEGVGLANGQLELLRTMVKAGTAAERDLLAADSDLAEAEQNLHKAENGVAIAEANLVHLMGCKLPAGSALSPKFGGMQLPSQWEPMADRAAKENPQIQLLEKQLQASDAGVKLAGIEDRPFLSARATALAQNRTAFTDTHYFAGSLVLTWKPFDRWKSRMDADQARSQSERLKSLLVEAKSGIRLAMEKAWRDGKDAEARMGLSARQSTSAAEALRVSRLRYEAGTATELEVSGAILAVHRAQSNSAQAEIDLHLATIEFDHAATGTTRFMPAKPSLAGAKH